MKRRMWKRTELSKRQHKDMLTCETTGNFQASPIGCWGPMQGGGMWPQEKLGVKCQDWAFPKGTRVRKWAGDQLVKVYKGRSDV